MASRIPAKRYREHSIATPIVGCSNSQPSSTLGRSSPVSRRQAVQTRKHVTLRPPSSRVASSSPVSPAYLPAWPEDDEAIAERDDDDSLNEVVMAVDMKEKGTVGCCYYVAREEKLYILEDVKCGGLDVIDILKLHIQPTTILLSTRVDEGVDHHLDPDGRGRDSVRGSDDQFRLPYALELRPSPEFHYEAAKNKLAALRLGTSSQAVFFSAVGDAEVTGRFSDDHEAGVTGHRGRLLRLAGWIDLESVLSVGCAGAVLAYMQRRKSVGCLPRDVDGMSTVFRIASIEMFSLQDTMFVNTDTLVALQILHSESHPNSHNQGPTKNATGSKEGLSVYGLFHNLACTPQGKSLLRQYFLRPSLDLTVINERLDSISVFLRPDNQSHLKDITKSLRRVKNIRAVLIHIRKGVSSGLSKGGGINNGVWSSLRSFAYHTLNIRDILSAIVGAENLSIRAKVFETFDARQLATIGRTVSEIVDFTASAEMHRTVVNPGVDEELDGKKQMYDGVEDLLNQTSQTIAATVPDHFALELNVIFFPQIGFLISVPIIPGSGTGYYEGGQENDQHWDRVFSTRTRVYYKDFRMRELDAEIGDMYAEICDREIEIVHELGQQVLEYADVLGAVSDVCAELDSLLALAQGATLYKLTKPRMTQNNILCIKAGRHPLQELTVPSYIANDIYIVGGSCNITPPQRDGDTTPKEARQIRSTGQPDEGPNMLLMTGPNYSGKSVYLKQTALIVYMAHIGCFVPADSAVIGITDKIIARIASRESVSKVESTFMIDLQQIALVINLATSRSLVIIDEFGKGTESNDGAGLACGLFQHFLGLGRHCPKVLGATHFHEIFENGYLEACSVLAFGHMEVYVDKGVAAVENQITYLYNFRAGRSASSYGSCCAAMNGIAPKLIERAEELGLLSAKGENLVAACAKVSEIEVEALVVAEETARKFLAFDFTSQMSPGMKRSKSPRELLDHLMYQT